MSDKTSIEHFYLGNAHQVGNLSLQVVCGQRTRGGMKMRCRITVSVRAQVIPRRSHFPSVSLPSIIQNEPAAMLWRLRTRPRFRETRNRLLIKNLVVYSCTEGSRAKLQNIQKFISSPWLFFRYFEKRNSVCIYVTAARIHPLDRSIRYLELPYHSSRITHFWPVM